MSLRRNQSNKTNSIFRCHPCPRCLGVQEAALYLGASIWAIRTLAWEEKVPFIRLGQRLFFDREDLDKSIDCSGSGVDAGAEAGNERHSVATLMKQLKPGIPIVFVSAYSELPDETIGLTE
jgi:hypothetical protein